MRIENNERLKTCPFCGEAPDLLVVQNTERANCFWVECNNENCACGPSSDLSTSESEALRKWNNRSDSKKEATNADTTD